MNERIKELWDKAATASAAYPSGQNNSWETQVNFMEKYTESVIRECAKVYWGIDNGEQHSEYVDALKKHFGIKE